MAHTKAGGSTRNGRDSNAKRLGVKLYGGQVARAGQIIVRQRGTKWEPGDNVETGRDDTIYAKTTGLVRYANKRILKFTGKRQKKTVVNIDPIK